MSAARTKLMRDLMMVCAGHPTGVALPALTDVLASMIAFSTVNREMADAFVDSLGPDLKKAIAENWSYVASVKAASGGRAGAG